VKRKQNILNVPVRKNEIEVQAPVRAGVAGALVRAMEHRKFVKRTDFVPYYKPSDDIYGSATGQDERPALEDLASVCNTRLGVAWMGTNGVAGDAIRNWHMFVDPDSQKEIKNDTTKAVYQWAVKTDLKNQVQQWLRWTLGMGTGWLVKYWTKNDLQNMQQAPNLSIPPRRFRAFSPRYMSPINLDKSNELNYQEDVWRFSGGEINQAYNIHQDRVEVLTLYPEEGHWRGLSVTEPVWMPLMGYFQNFIYITKGLRRWGDAVPAMFTGEGLPQPGEVTSVLDLMDEYQMNYKWALGKDDRLEFIQTKIGNGINEVMEQYKEEISSAWRIPLNQLFGRSVGGGLAGAGALVSKEDYLQEISNKQMACSDNLLKIYTEAGFEVDSYDILWNLAIKKTDEQRMREEGMEKQNKILDEQWKQAKIQTQMLKLQLKAARWQSLQPEGMGGEEGGEEGGEVEGEEAVEEGGEEEEPMEVPELSDLEKQRRHRFWKSIHIENYINFPYGDKR